MGWARVRRAAAAYTCMYVCMCATLTGGHRYVFCNWKWHSPLHARTTNSRTHPASQPTNRPAERCQTKSSAVKLYHCAAFAFATARSAAQHIPFTSFDLTRMHWEQARAPWLPADGSEAAAPFAFSSIFFAYVLLRCPERGVAATFSFPICLFYCFLLLFIHLTLATLAWLCAPIRMAALLDGWLPLLLTPYLLLCPSASVNVLNMGVSLSFVWTKKKQKKNRRNVHVCVCLLRAFWSWERAHIYIRTYIFIKIHTHITIYGKVIMASKARCNETDIHYSATYWRYNKHANTQLH